MSDTRGLRLHQIIGYEYSPPNLLANGGFNIWQRGTSFTPASGNLFNADEWTNYGSNSLVTYSREASVVKHGSYSMRMVVGVTSQTWQLRQGIEHYEELEGLWLTFSVWVRCAGANQVYAGLSDHTAAGDEWAQSYYNKTAGAWEQLTVLKQIRNGQTTVANRPHSFAVSAGIVGAVPSTTIYVSGATLVVGQYPEGVPYIPPESADDWERCQRFYEYGSAFLGHASTPTPASATFVGELGFRTRKYSSPSLTGSVFTAGGGNFAGSTATASAGVDGIQLSISNSGDPGGTYAWEASVP